MNKLGYLDSIRGLACICVILSHASLLFFPYIHAFSGEAPGENYIQALIHNSPLTFAFSGTGAVYVFFVLSGLVLSRSVARKDSIGLISTVAARYPRLMIPALASCIIAYVVFSSISNLPNPEGLSDWFYSQASTAPSFFGAVKSGAVDAFFLGNSTYNAVLWTMQIELAGSLLVYFFMHMTKYINKYYISAFFLCSVFASYAISAKFAGGLFCFWVGFNMYISDLKIRGIPLSIAALLLGLYLGGAHDGSHSYAWIEHFLKGRTYFVCNIIAGVLIVWSVHSCEPFQRALSTKWLIWLGQKSFSIYLFHMSAIILFSYVAFDYLNKILGYDAAAILSTFIILILTLLASAALSFVDDYSVSLSKSVGTKTGSLFSNLQSEQAQQKS